MRRIPYFQRGTPPLPPSQGRQHLQACQVHTRTRVVLGKHTRGSIRKQKVLTEHGLEVARPVTHQPQRLSTACADLRLAWAHRHVWLQERELHPAPVGALSKITFLPPYFSLASPLHTTHCNYTVQSEYEIHVRLSLSLSHLSSVFSTG